VRRCAETLTKRGDHVDVIVLRKKGQKYRESMKGVNIYRIQQRTINESNKLTYLFKILLFLFNSSIFLILLHTKIRYDLIHVHSVPDFEVFAAWFPKLFRSKLILDIHDILPEFYSSKFGSSKNSIIYKLLILCEKISIHFADHVIISNHIWYKRLLSRSIKKEKCTVIINYPDPSIFYRRGSIRYKNKFILSYPGTLNYHQGLDIAIKAIALIKDKEPNVEFRIYGEGPEKQNLLTLVKELELKNYVYFEGLLPMEEIADALRNVDLGIVPKRKDSFGNEAFSTKIMEFMSLGIPVIASSTKIDKFYFNSSIILFFKSEDEYDLARKILKLKNNKNLRNIIKDEALKFIEKNNWNVKKYEYLDLVDFLVNNRGNL